MIREIRNVFGIMSAVIIGSLVVFSCDPNPDNLGSQFFSGNAAQDVDASYDIIAYTVRNGNTAGNFDTIRTDAARINTTYATPYVTLGAFKENVFGLQKSSYVTQLRLNSYSPDFGKNPVMDSVVLAIHFTNPTITTEPTLYASDSITTTTDDNYIYPDGNIAATKKVDTYPLVKYGKTKIDGKTKLTLNVNEINDYITSAADKYYSNKQISTGTLLGTKTINGDVNAITITKKSDNTTITEGTKDVSIRIPLDSLFFQNKIIAHQGKPELQDVASFIRYFRGIKISVAEDDGFLFRFNPNQVTLTMFYKNDNTATDGTVTRVANTFDFDLTSTQLNTQFNQIANDYAGTEVESAFAATDSISGNPKIYMQGMGGPGIGLKIPAPVIRDLIAKYKNDKIGVIGAKIRLHTDDSSWNNNYEKPSFFTVQKKDVATFLDDITTYSINLNFSLVRPYNITQNPAYYDIDITKTLKEAIENGANNNTLTDSDLEVNLIANAGAYLYTTTGGLLGSLYTENNWYNSRSYTPNRVVFVGTDSSNPNAVKLNITYAKK
jgi:hypothetical protein